MHPAVLVTTVLGAVFTLAIVAVVFSQKANTTGVITGAGSALASVINAAVSPITGGATNLGNAVTNTLGTTTANPQVLGTFG